MKLMRGVYETDVGCYVQLNVVCATNEGCYMPLNAVHIITGDVRAAPPMPYLSSRVTPGLLLPCRTYHHG